MEDLIEHTQDEKERLAALSEYHVMDTASEIQFDAITRLAAYICKTPISLVSLVDESRQWSKSKYGLGTLETLNDISFCRYTIKSDEILEVDDTLNDTRFAENPLVTGSPHIRFYAGAPLITPEGHRLGSLCVIDNKPNTLDNEQRDALRILANEVISHFEVARKNRQLQESLSRYEEFDTMFNTSGELHCIFDETGIILMINRTVTELLGFQVDEVIGKSMWDFVVPEDKEKNLELIHGKLDAGITQFEFETRTRTNGGKVKWISWATSFKGGKWFSNGRDNTKQKELLSELEQLSVVANKVNSGVVISGAHNEVIWVNESFNEITGYSMAEVTGHKLGDIIQGEDTDAETIRAAREHTKNKKSFSVEILAYRKDGRQIWLSIMNSVILNSAGDIEKVVEIITDISERKKVEQELIKTREEALQLSKAKELFVSVMSHEIRTPLNAVIGMAHILRDDNPTPSQLEHLDILKFSAENLLSLLNAILDFTKIDSGNLDLESVEINVRQLVTRTMDSFLFKAKEKGIALQYEIDHRIPEYILGDQTRLYQVLINLIGNSIKFTHQGEVKLKLTLMAETSEDVSVKFDISDTGIGIEKSKIDYIFEAYTQAKSDTSRKYGGTGLGLAITKRLIELFGSSIQVTSEEGKGSNFIFTIVFKRQSVVTVEEKITQKTFTGNVLVVDDNDINRLLARKVLAKWGLTADMAENGKIAVEKVLQKGYDLVLMDIHMPEMDGFEAVREIRKQTDPYFDTLPIIALTASILSIELENITNAGMNDFVQKPFAPNDLYKKIEKYFD